jgi:hypothetical protein
VALPFPVPPLLALALPALPFVAPELVEPVELLQQPAKDTTAARPMKRTTWRMGTPEERKVGLSTVAGPMSSRALLRVAARSHSWTRAVSSLGMLDDPRFANWLGLPLAFAVALLFQTGKWGRFLIGTTIGMEVHELGHAVVAWLGSRFAVPLPWLTMAGGHASVLMYLVVLGALGFVARTAYRERCLALAALCACLGLVQLVLTIGLSHATVDTLFDFGGQGGELYLAALLVVAFYYRMPEVTYWSHVRWLFLLVGACVFVPAFQRWSHAHHDLAAIPWGSMLGLDGDMDKLRDVAGWAPARIVHVYLVIAWSCVVAIAGHYLYFLWPGAPGRVSRRSPASPRSSPGGRRPGA